MNISGNMLHFTLFRHLYNKLLIKINNTKYGDYNGYTK